MADGTAGATVWASIPTGDHARHDLLLVAEAADRGGRLPAAQAACPDCQALHAELVSLAAALPMAALPARPRDYTLRPADAERLRPAGWRRLLGAIGTSRDVVTRPLAIGLTTLGLAGLLVATVPGALTGSLGSAGAAPSDTNVPAAANEAAVPAASSAASAAATAAPAPAIRAPAAAAPVPSGAAASGPLQLEIASEAPKNQADQNGTDTARASATSEPDDLFYGGDDESATTDTTTAAGGAGGQTSAPATGAIAADDEGTGASVLVVLAGLMLVVGLGLFTLRWNARRA